MSWSSVHVSNCVSVIFKSVHMLRVYNSTYFYHGPDVSRAMVMWPPIQDVTDTLKEQTRTNMSQPGRRPGTAVGDEWHVLQALWSRKDI